MVFKSEHNWVSASDGFCRESNQKQRHSFVHAMLLWIEKLQDLTSQHPQNIIILQTCGVSPQHLVATIILSNVPMAYVTYDEVWHKTCHPSVTSFITMNPQCLFGHMAAQADLSQTYSHVQSAIINHLPVDWGTVRLKKPKVASYDWRW